MKKVGIFGAFDRINYGDFLFPLILKKILLENPDDKIETTDYGLVKKNLIGYGETHCKSVNQLYNDENNAIIVAGGDVLSADWKALFECIYGNKHHKNGIDGFAKKLFKGQYENLFKILLRGRTSLPFCIEPSDFKFAPKIIYNSVGGSGLKNIREQIKKEIGARISKAHYLSFRDSQTANVLKNYISKDLIIEPDIASLISEFFPVESLESKKSSGFSTLYNRELSNTPYFVFQSSLYLGRGMEDEISKELNKISSMGLKIVLLPIGKAYWHEDHIFLKKLKNIHCMPLLVDCTNIFDIAYLIAKSNGFAGTSLHGAITSMAYSVPHVGLNPSISKLVAYFEDWAFGETRSVVPFKEMHSQFVINSSISKSSYQENSKMLSNLSLGRIDQIKKIIAAS